MRCTNHLAAKSGDVLTVRAPEFLALCEVLRSERNPVQRVAYNGKIFATGLRDHQALTLAIEKLDADPCLQRLDLMAHGSLRDAQFFGRSRETLVPRRGLKGLEGVQRGQAAKHQRRS